MLIRHFLLCFFILLGSFGARAGHIIGGELYYTCLGGNRYEITLELYRDCNCTDCASLNETSIITFFDKNRNVVRTIEIDPPNNIERIPTSLRDECLVKPFGGSLCVERGVFRDVVTLGPLDGGYTMVYQRCCRNNTIKNIFGPDNQGATYIEFIPDPGGEFGCNSSPRYNNPPPNVVCGLRQIDFDHSATDPDGDQLRYYICEAFTGASPTIPKPDVASQPPYLPVAYKPTYSPTYPMDSDPAMAIDSLTGFLTGVPSVTSGQYVVGICVEESRNGKVIAVHRRDFQFNLGDCTKTLEAEMNINGQNFFDRTDTLIICDDFEVLYENAVPLSNTNNEWYWDFGDFTTTTDTSTLREPGIYTYPDTGIYPVIVVAGTNSNCIDTHQMYVGIYPGFDIDFQYDEFCFGEKAIYEDASVARYGNMNYWQWNLGNGTLALGPEVEVIYTEDRTYFVELYATSDIGCEDTLIKAVSPLPAPVAEFNFTPPCLGTPINFTILDNANNSNLNRIYWTFDTGDSSNALSPVYQYNTVGDYFVTLLLEHVNGCIHQTFEVLSVAPASVVELDSAGQVCANESIQLNATTQNVTSFDWSPKSSLFKPEKLNPIAAPTVNTEYTFSYANECDGGEATINIEVLPVPEVALDGFYEIEFGDTVELSVGDIGSGYSWFPINGISNSTSSTINAFPEFDTEYTVFVTGENGCIGKATTFIDVNPECKNVIGPSAFTPDKDGLNDHFYIVNYGGNDIYDLRIWNRWGEPVYQSANNEPGWDGTIEGKEAPLGVYAWEAFVNCNSSKTIRLTGNVTLLR